MSERNKKYLIVFLLLGACLISSFLLVHSSGSAVRTLSSLSEADSLLKNNLETFNIAQSQIREQVISFDSSKTRKVYHVRVPEGFSKTQLHHEIHNTFLKYEVRSPARIIFPEKDFHIHLLKNNTIFATVRLNTDPELVLQRSFGSILVAFESKPSRHILEKIEEFGEPIPVVLMIDDTDEVSDLTDELMANQSDILFWLKSEDGSNLPGNNSLKSLPKLQLLQRETPNAGVLSFINFETVTDNNLQNLAMTDLNYVDVSDAVLLQSNMGKTAFKQELNKFSRNAQQGRYPIAIVMAEEKSLNWLQQELAGFKKRGLRIVPPKKKRFQ